MEDAKAAFFASLAELQGEIRGATKDSSNPYFNSRYADLKTVWNVWTDYGPKHGFSVIQAYDDPGDRKGIVLVTRLAHKSGHVEESRLYLPAAKHDPQGCGSAMTYARRYALSAMVGIVQVDDDGEAAMAAFRPGKPRGDSAQFLKQEAERHARAGDTQALADMLELPNVKADKNLSAGIQKRIDQLSQKGQ